MAEAAPEDRPAKPGLAARVMSAGAGLAGIAAGLGPYWRHRSWRRLILAGAANVLLLGGLLTAVWWPPAPAMPAAGTGHAEPAHDGGPSGEAPPLATVDAPPPAGPGAGDAPAAASGGPPRWLANAGSFDRSDTRPRVAVVLAEVGTSKSLTDLALRKLPAGITLAVQPAIGRADMLIGKARDAGHEVLLMLPMEPDGFPADDPGPRALLVNLSTAETADRLDWLLSRSLRIAGLATYQGSRFKADSLALAPVLERLRGEGLLLLDSGGTPGGVLAAEAAKAEVPALTADARLDALETKAGIDTALAALEQAARDTGSAVGVIRPSPLAIERLAAWQLGLDERGIALAPLSAVWLKRALLGGGR